MSVDVKKEVRSLGETSGIDIISAVLILLELQELVPHIHHRPG